MHETHATDKETSRGLHDKTPRTALHTQTRTTTVGIPTALQLAGRQLLARGSHPMCPKTGRVLHRELRNMLVTYFAVVAQKLCNDPPTPLSRHTASRAFGCARLGVAPSQGWICTPAPRRRLRQERMPECLTVHR